MGPLGVTLSGVLIESTLWAVHNGFIYSDELQYGHALGPRPHYLHYHAAPPPRRGGRPADEDTLVGVALDGEGDMGRYTGRYGEIWSGSCWTARVWRWHQRSAYSCATRALLAHTRRTSAASDLE